MKDKERFISIDDSGESIFTFDEADMIIDTKTNIVYGANNVPDLVKILNSQSSQWQKLKEWLEEKKSRNERRLKEAPINTEFYIRVSVQGITINKILTIMQELEGE